MHRNMHGKVGLLAVDLDGTLLRSDDSITASNRRAIHKATSNGVQIVIATGRPYDEATHLLKPIHCPLPMLDAGGADIRDTTGRSLRTILLGVEQAVAVLTTLLQYDLTRTTIYTSDGALILEGPELQQRACNIIPAILAARIKILKILVSPIERKMLQRELTARLSQIEGINVTSSAPWNIEILHQAANKGASLKWLASKYGVRFDQQAAVGDSCNDIDMFAAVGTSFAVANAPTNVKRKATVALTKTCDEDGVAQAIEVILQM